jgi:Na+/melibiose symporter-like transporter
MLPRAMMADAGDEELLDAGVDRTGLLYAWITSVYKIGQAASIGFVFLILDFVHFNPAKGTENHPLAAAILLVLYGAVPVLLCAAAAVVLWWFPLTAARHAEIRAQLDKRTSQANTVSESTDREDAPRALIKPDAPV